MTFAPRIWSVEDRAAPFVDVFRRTASQAGYDVRVIVPTVEPPGFARLRSRYRHLSPNSERFELASFRRWFEIGAVVSPSDRFIVADTDLVVQGGFTEVPEELRDSGTVVGSIGATDDVLEEGISGGFSLWTGQRLKEFCDYMVARYESGADALAELHERKRAASNPNPGVSDMTLLYGWVKDTRVPFANSNRIINGRYIDHNLSMPGCVGATFQTAIGLKALRFARDGIWLTTQDGRPVRPICLHLGGRCKIMARNIETGQIWRILVKSLYILGGRAARRWYGQFVPRT